MSTVLVVDDEETTLLLVKKILSSGGYEVDSYTSPVEALMNYEPNKYDLILSDFYMPELDGDQFLKKIREKDPETAFMFLTNNTNIQNAITMMKHGADDYITKPVIPEDLSFRAEKNIKEAENRRIIQSARQEKELLELENKKLVNWRLLYATKDIRQTEQMISLLSRTINQSGGFLWVDILKSTLEKIDEDSYKIGSDLVDMIVSTAESQKNIFDYITFISEIDKIPLSITSISMEEFKVLLAECLTQLDRELCRKAGRKLVISLQEPGDGYIRADCEYMKKILKELVVNAMKYSPPETDIVAVMERKESASGDTVDIFFRNVPRPSKTKDSEGNPILGIPYDYTELVFDLFYSIEPFPTYIEQEEWSDGTGLYVCRKLMKRMDGWIRANNGMDYTGENPSVFVKVTLTFQVRSKEET